ncbi:MAG: HAD hydrolase-like protein, partial [Candidatus Hydrogenedentota bacterium]
MAKPALIIFDVDGTLLQSQRITIPAIRETLTAYGVSPPNDDAIRATFGIPVQEYEAWLEGWCPPERAAELVDATNERELELISQGGALFPGVVEMLEALKDVGHALVTCTNASLAYLDRVLNTYELHRFFQMSVCIGHGFASKTAMVSHIIDTIPLRPAVVVG